MDDFEKYVAKYVGNKLREIRKSAILTQAQMASMLNIRQNSYATYENGVNFISVSDIVLLSVVLGFDPGCLFPVSEYRTWILTRPESELNLIAPPMALSNKM